MNQQIPPAAETAFDRRFPNRESSSWVRVALDANNAKIDKVAADLEELADLLAKAIPDNDPKQHVDAHARLIQWEIQRKKEDEEREKDADERKQFRLRIKQTIIQHFLTGAGVILLSLLVIGGQTKVREWIFAPSPLEQPSQGVKK